MKVSRSARSGSVVVAAAYLAAHLPFLAPSLEDIDSINFALGLRDFDVASHQPHPPGYPVYIALGRLSLSVIAAVASSLPPVRAEALALAVWSAIAGALALVAGWAFFVEIERRRSDGGSKEQDPRYTENRRAGLASQDAPPWAVALLAVSPLFWISGLRPLSDLPGLASALVAQACIMRGMNERRQLVAGAFVAAVAAGIRVQTVLLTVPLLALAIVRQRRAGAWWLLSRPVAALLVGGIAWGLPLLAASGGLGGYLTALGTQAGEDFAWVDMLWANPTPRRLAYSLYETLVLPWSLIPLAVLMLAAAVMGAAAAFVNDRRALLLLGVAFGPYAFFHLLFQETYTVRYALPLLPAVAWLAVRGALAAGRAGPVAAIVLVACAAFVSIPVGVAYGRETHPAFRAIAAMEERALTTSADPAVAGRPVGVYSHYSLRRPLQVSPPAGVRVVEPRPSYEWLGLVDYWRGGGRDRVWFLADPRRTDLELIDRHSRGPIRYRWTVGERAEFAGTRPTGVDFYMFEPPGWFAGEGWSLTPETGGIARAAGTGPDRRPIESYVRRRAGAMHLVVGGRHLGASGDPSVIFDLAIDGIRVDSWTLDPAADLNFLRFIDLPHGLPPGGSDYARLTIAARAAQSNRPTPAVAVRQFDIQPAEWLIYGFGEGWHEEEYDNVTGLRWRWTSQRSMLRVSPPSSIRLSIRGESPLKYLDAAPLVRITAAGREIATLRPSDDFEWRVAVPADAVEAAQGLIGIETDRVYLPGQAEGTADTRRLGLRLFEIDVHPVAP